MTEQNRQGERIRDARLARGWSQARLAREAGVAENTVLAAEQGKRRTQGDNLQAIIDALGMATLEDEAWLDLDGVPEDARAFLRVAAARLAAMNEDIRARLLNALYPRLIADESPAQRDVDAYEAGRRELAEQADTPEKRQQA